jgi:hypothetical protein
MAVALEAPELTAQLARLVGLLELRAGGGPMPLHELTAALLAPYLLSVSRVLAGGDAVGALHMLGGTADRPISKPVQTALLELLALHQHHGAPGGQQQRRLAALPALLSALRTDYLCELAGAGQAVGVVRMVGGPAGCPLVDEGLMQLLEAGSDRRASVEARITARAGEAQHAQVQEQRLAAYAAWHLGRRGGSCWRRNIRRRLQRLCGSRPLAKGLLELLEWQGVLRGEAGGRRLALAPQDALPEAAPSGGGGGGGSAGGGGGAEGAAVGC